MINGLAKVSLLVGVPVAALAAYGVLSYYQGLGACVRESGSKQEACLRDYTKSMPEPNLEVAMATCRKAELFLSLYKADESTRRRFPNSRDEVEARYAEVCQR